MKITLEGEPHELRELLTGNSFQSQAIPVRATREATSAEIRAWARANRIPVAKKGYMPKDVVELYYREH